MASRIASLLVLLMIVSPDGLRAQVPGEVIDEPGTEIAQLPAEIRDAPAPLAKMAAMGVALGGLGFAAGYGIVDIAMSDDEPDDNMDPGLYLGAFTGSIGMGLGIHLGNWSRGDALLTTLATFAVGAGGTLAIGRDGEPESMAFLPPLQLAAGLAVECLTTRRSTATSGPRWTLVPPPDGQPVRAAGTPADTLADGAPLSAEIGGATDRLDRPGAEPEPFGRMIVNGLGVGAAAFCVGFFGSAAAGEIDVFKDDIKDPFYIGSALGAIGLGLGVDHANDGRGSWASTTLASVAIGAPGALWIVDQPDNGGSLTLLVPLLQLTAAIGAQLLTMPETADPASADPASPTPTVSAAAGATAGAASGAAAVRRPAQRAWTGPYVSLAPVPGGGVLAVSGTF